MADTPYPPARHPVYGEAAPPHAHLLAAIDREIPPWQMRIIDEVMSLPGRASDLAYTLAAGRCRAAAASLVREHGRGAEPLAVFYDEVAAYYRNAPKLSRMHSAYRRRALRRTHRHGR